ncbi:hypothetical protein EXIGLDRAFT_397411 [Exidia glandulosa HHB12029]|uniref:Uncharacterized protein n=1 Tax=Exidia glandulosa HHB12029 TaxID=1314781 RepID=A0A166B140_EXIGL|nr:hypothetical protein EXIGLDRAFT_397411 [Exidia glandulosa HHB12029]
MNFTPENQKEMPRVLPGSSVFYIASAFPSASPPFRPVIAQMLAVLHVVLLFVFMCAAAPIHAAGRRAAVVDAFTTNAERFAR